MIDGITTLVCHNCGYEWKPKTPSPKECPCCKIHLHVSEKQQKKIQTEREPPVIVEAKEIVSDIFTAQCSEAGCESDAIVKFKGKFLCEVHMLKAMKESGMLRDV